MSATPTVFDRLRRVLTLLTDPRTPKLPRLAVVAAVVYFISPIDVVPDPLLPVVGYLDDFMMVWMALRWLIKRDPDAASTAAGRTPGTDAPRPPALLS
jgi:uncharacterized membrane protein YkvA (DUF1232 family)